LTKLYRRTGRYNPRKMYALFGYDHIHNTTTFINSFELKNTAIELAGLNHKDHMWFAIYKYNENTIVFDSIPAKKCILDTKFAGKTATILCPHYTPMEVAYRLNDGQWFFKSF